MPSDAKKRRDAAKKQAAKNRNKVRDQKLDKENNEGIGSPTREPSPDAPIEEWLYVVQINYEILSAGQKLIKNGIKPKHGTSIPELPLAVYPAAAMLEKMELENTKARSAAGALTSHPLYQCFFLSQCNPTSELSLSMDIKVEGLTVTFHGREIVTDTKLELNMGRRYGLIGLNGS
ncbi:unnamed protein product, partial [Gongylonema pulchrum]|uniref:POP1 domain-containing protein n=1 Tax=Gongylonema pulchrum TaxID=637853 RepID=A0A183E2S1_9BILA